MNERTRRRVVFFGTTAEATTKRVRSKGPRRGTGEATRGRKRRAARTTRSPRDRDIATTVASRRHRDRARVAPRRGRRDRPSSAIHPSVDRSRRSSKSASHHLGAHLEVEVVQRRLQKRRVVGHAARERREDGPRGRAREGRGASCESGGGEAKHRARGSDERERKDNAAAVGDETSLTAPPEEKRFVGRVSTRRGIRRRAGATWRRPSPRRSRRASSPDAPARHRVDAVADGDLFASPPPSRRTPRRRTRTGRKRTTTTRIRRGISISRLPRDAPRAGCRRPSPSR